MANLKNPVRIQRTAVAALAFSSVILVGAAAFRFSSDVHMGKQEDGTFVLATGQRIGPGDIKFRGRPSDLALNPDGQTFAVLGQGKVFLCRENGVIDGTSVPLGADSGFRGAVWTPDGKRLLVTSADGWIGSFDYDGSNLIPGPHIDVGDGKRNPVPEGTSRGECSSSWASRPSSSSRPLGSRPRAGPPEDAVTCLEAVEKIRAHFQMDSSLAGLTKSVMDADDAVRAYSDRHPGTCTVS